MSSELSQLIRVLNLRPVSVPPVYKMIVGSYNAAVVLAQIMYWHSKMGREFYKTDSDFSEELYMSLKEFRNAKKKITDVPFITIAKRGVPQRTFYDVNYDVFCSIMKRVVPNLLVQNDTEIDNKGHSSLSHMVQTEVYQKVQTEVDHMVQTNTESTTESTSKKKDMEYDSFLSSFNELTGRKLRVLGQKAKRQYNALLKSGYSSEDVLRAAKACSENEFFQKPSNRKYLTPEYITRADKFTVYFDDQPDQGSTSRRVESASV